MLRPRTIGRIVIAVLIVCALMASLIFAIEVKNETFYKGFRAITYAIMGLTFATVYRYFED
jgi:hypothetical protein